MIASFSVIACCCRWLLDFMNKWSIPVQPVLLPWIFYSNYVSTNTWYMGYKQKWSKIFYTTHDYQTCDADSKLSSMHHVKWEYLEILHLSRGRFGIGDRFQLNRYLGSCAFYSKRFAHVSGWYQSVNIKSIIMYHLEMYRGSSAKSSKFQFYCLKDNKSHLTLQLLSNSAEKEDLDCITLYIP